MFCISENLNEFYGKDYKNYSFSIILTTYNRQEYIEDAVQSVLEQRYKNWELIIVDDGSKDNTTLVLSPYLFDNDKIKYYSYYPNKGCGYAKWYACTKCSKDIIVVLDSDDILRPSTLEVLNLAYNQMDMDFIYTNHLIMDEKYDSLKLNRWIKEKDGIPDWKEHRVGQLRTFRRSMYKKSDGYDKKLKIAVDRDLVLKFEEINAKFYFLNIPLYYRRVHNECISKKEPFETRKWLFKVHWKMYKRRIFTNHPKPSIFSLLWEWIKIKIVRKIFKI